MANLKHNPVQNDVNEMPQFRVDTKDGFASENCYSFGDHDMNLRDKK